MNVHMWQHPTVQRNITALKRLGLRLVGPDVGKLACGYEAIGHLAETEEIIRAVKQLVPPPPGGSADASGEAARPRTNAPKRPKKGTRRPR
jgi:phosphopantothenoylcysteine decarboxylase/phosphopantothenate--cysteine ligase